MFTNMFDASGVVFFFFVRFANVSILHVFAMSVLTSFLYFVLLCDCFVKDIV